ncbi:potassium channel family protein [Saccharothrix carnea]|uniref:potassium channel family protein n=1 Tax=Saccharothrix carnea TaxID=1280637 RepID=UPI003CCC26A7
MDNETVAVIGLGRFGSALALELTSLGAEVLAIDNRPKIVQSYASRLPHVVTADSTDAEALRQLGVPEFQRVVVAIGSDLEASIMTTSLLVEMDTTDIWAKAVSRQHGRILERVGAHHVVLPEHDSGERVAHLLTGRILDYIEVDEDYAMAKTKPPARRRGHAAARVEPARQVRRHHRLGQTRDRRPAGHLQLRHTRHRAHVRRHRPRRRHHRRRRTLRQRPMIPAG